MGAFDGVRVKPEERAEIALAQFADYIEQWRHPETYKNFLGKQSIHTTYEEWLADTIAHVKVMERIIKNGDKTDDGVYKSALEFYRDFDKQLQDAIDAAGGYTPTTQIPEPTPVPGPDEELIQIPTGYKIVKKVTKKFSELTIDEADQMLRKVVKEVLQEVLTDLRLGLE